jgi:aminopeptidase N
MSGLAEPSPLIEAPAQVEPLISVSSSSKKKKQTQSQAKAAAAAAKKALTPAAPVMVREDPLGTFRYRQPVAVPSYLIALAAGDLESAEIRLYSYLYIQMR